MGGVSPQIKGIGAMILGALLLASNDATSKFLSESYPVGQILGLRHAVALAIILAYVHWSAGWQALRIGNRTGQALRSATFVATTVLVVVSLSLLPLATVTAIAFSSPIFVVAFSGPMLGERVGPRRWLAVLIGFAGVLLIVRPGTAAFDWLLLLPALAAVCAGLRDGFTRQLSRTDSSISILFWSTACVVAGTLTTVPFGWQPVDLSGAAWLVLNGALNAGAHFLMIEALRLGDASLVAPFRYSGIVFAALLGLIVWGHVPDGWTLAGAAVIIASGIYIIEREAGASPTRG